MIFVGCVEARNELLTHRVSASNNEIGVSATRKTRLDTPYFFPFF